MSIVKLDWNSFKTEATNRGLFPAFVQEAGSDLWVLWMEIYGRQIETTIEVGSAEETDFINNYKPKWEIQIENRDIDGNLIVKTDLSETGIGLWINSPNLTSTTDWIDSVQGICFEWIPNPGTKLLVIESSVVYDPTANLAGEIRYRGIKNGLDGISPNPYWFDRVYLNKWDYFKSCDTVVENSDKTFIKWHYPKPIILKSSENAKIQLYIPNGALTGTDIYMRLKCIALVE